MLLTVSKTKNNIRRKSPLKKIKGENIIQNTYEREREREREREIRIPFFGFRDKYVMS